MSGKLPQNIKTLARNYTDVALGRLSQIITQSENDSAVVSACNSILDRGWGKPAQPHTGEDGEGPLEIVLRTIVEERAKKASERK